MCPKYDETFKLNEKNHQKLLNLNFRKLDMVKLKLSPKPKPEQSKASAIAKKQLAFLKVDMKPQQKNIKIELGNSGFSTS